MQPHKHRKHEFDADHPDAYTLCSRESEQRNSVAGMQRRDGCIHARSLTLRTFGLAVMFGNCTLGALSPDLWRCHNDQSEHYSLAMNGRVRAPWSVRNCPPSALLAAQLLAKMPLSDIIVSNDDNGHQIKVRYTHQPTIQCVPLSITTAG